MIENLFKQGSIVELSLIGQPAPFVACIVDVNPQGFLVYRGRDQQRKQFFPWRTVLAVTESPGLTLEAARARLLPETPAALFQTGVFALHSGERSSFKIDCDALTDGELTTLAGLLVSRLPAYYTVEGVPRGGLRLAHILREKASDSPHDPLLIVDDVYTTGNSMEEHKDGRWAIGAVLFARRPVTHPWITPLWTMAPLTAPE
jgi:hypothetical protein